MAAHRSVIGEFSLDDVKTYPVLGPMAPAHVVPGAWRFVQVVFLLYATIGAVIVEGLIAKWDPHFDSMGNSYPTHSAWSVFWAFLIAVLPGLFQVFYVEYVARALDERKKVRFIRLTWGLIALWAARNAVVHRRQNEARSQS